MTWVDAIQKVLNDAGEPLHYADIVQRIIDNKYRTSVGATPARTVASNLGTLVNDGKVVKVATAVYATPKYSGSGSPEESDRRLQGSLSQPDSAEAQAAESTDTSMAEAEAEAEEMGLINAFGMFWRRSEIDWSATNPRILGVQQEGAKPTNFGGQAGVYMLYDGARIVYVGRTTSTRLGVRLREHTRDRLTGRWDKFSWFGVCGVRDDGTLGSEPGPGISVDILIETMEALLIEGLEPPQNRRRGDRFNAVEFIQQTDPAVQKKRKEALWQEMSSNL